MGVFGRLFRNEGEQQANQVTEQVVRENQFTLFHDAHHGELSHFVHFASRENVDAMARGGLKHIGMEFREGRQELIDKYYNKEISKEQFVKEWGQFNDHLTPKEGKIAKDKFADFIDYTREKDIKVYAIDDGGKGSVYSYAQGTLYPNKNQEPPSELKAKDFNKTLDYFPDTTDKKVFMSEVEKLDLPEDANVMDKKYKEQIREVAKRTGYDIKTVADGMTLGDYKSAIEKVDPANYKRFSQAVDNLGYSDDTVVKGNHELKMAVYDKFFEEREALDKQAAKRLVEKSHGEKAGVYYGMAHGSREGDLDEELGRHGKVGKIGFAGSKSDMNLVYAEAPATVIYTNANGKILPGTPTRVVQHEGRSVGGEVDMSKETPQEYNQKMKGFDIKSFQQSMGGQQQVVDDGRVTGEATAVDASVAKQGHQQRQSQQQSASAGR